MQDFRRLDVWRLSFDFARDVYKLTAAFPKDELYGLTSQLRRAALSISNNIAEGCGHNSNKALTKYLLISMGSTKEVENLLLFAKELNYTTLTTHDQLQERADHIGRMLNKLIQKLNTGSEE